MGKRLFWKCHDSRETLSEPLNIEQWNAAGSARLSLQSRKNYKLLIFLSFYTKKKQITKKNVWCISWVLRQPIYGEEFTCCNPVVYEVILEMVNGWFVFYCFQGDNFLSKLVKIIHLSLFLFLTLFFSFFLSFLLSNFNSVSFLLLSMSLFFYVCLISFFSAQLAWAAEYTVCFSAEG